MFIISQINNSLERAYHLIMINCFQAFDQQQQDLVDAASKALSYRQDIIEENIRLTYALQVAFMRYIMEMIDVYYIFACTHSLTYIIISRL